MDRMRVKSDAAPRCHLWAALLLLAVLLAPFSSASRVSSIADDILGATLSDALDSKSAGGSVVKANVGGVPLPMRMRAASGPVLAELSSSTRSTYASSAAAHAAALAAAAADAAADEQDLFSPPQLRVGRITDKLWMARADIKAKLLAQGLTEEQAKAAMPVGISLAETATASELDDLALYDASDDAAHGHSPVADQAEAALARSASALGSAADTASLSEVSARASALSATASAAAARAAATAAARAHAAAPQAPARDTTFIPSPPKHPWTKANPTNCDEGSACRKGLSTYTIPKFTAPFIKGISGVEKGLKIVLRKKPPRTCFMCTAYYDPIRSSFLSERALRAEEAIMRASFVNQHKQSVFSASNELKAIVSAGAPSGLSPEQMRAAAEAADKEKQSQKDRVKALAAETKAKEEAAAAARKAAAEAAAEAERFRNSPAGLKARAEALVRAKVLGPQAFLELGTKVTGNGAPASAPAAAAAAPGASNTPDHGPNAAEPDILGTSRWSDHIQFSSQPFYDHALSTPIRDRSRVGVAASSFDAFVPGSTAASPAAAATAAAAAAAATASEALEQQLRDEAAALVVTFPEFPGLSQPEQQALIDSIKRGDVEAGGYLFRRTELEGPFAPAKEPPVLQLGVGPWGVELQPRFGRRLRGRSGGSLMETDADADADYAHAFHDAYADSEAEAADAARDAALEAGANDGDSLMESASSASAGARFWDIRRARLPELWRNVTAAQPMQCPWRVGPTIVAIEAFKHVAVTPAEEQDLARTLAAAKAEIKPEPGMVVPPGVPYGWMMIKQFKLCANEKSKSFISVLATALMQGDGMAVECREG